MCLDVGRMSRYRICKIQNPHLEVAQIGCEKNGSFFVFTLMQQILIGVRCEQSI